MQPRKLCSVSTEISIGQSGIYRSARKDILQPSYQTVLISRINRSKRSNKDVKGRQKISLGCLKKQNRKISARLCMTG